MKRTGPTLRDLSGSLLLAAGATLATLAAAELAVRLLPERPKPVEATPPAADRGLPGDLPELTSVAALVRPDTRAVFKGVLHRTNSRGVRGPEYAPRPAEGTVRIVVAGDSYTMGQGVEEAEAYPAVAEALLNEAGPGRYEVINLGVSGLAIRHSMRRLERVGLPYAPHLLVVGFTPNDIFGPDYREPAPEHQAAAAALIGRFEDGPSALLRLVWPRLVLAVSAWRPIPGTYEHILEENYFENPAAWRQIEDGLEQLAGLAEGAGACGLVFVHTRINQLFFHPFTRIYERVAGAARARGLYAEVSLPWFRGEDVEALRLSAVDTHPNPRGHRLHGEALAAAVRALPAACLSRAQPSR